MAASPLGLSGIWADVTLQVDLEKLAEGLQKLSEDDLLNIVTLIHDNKTSDTYTKNDVESMCPCLVEIACADLSRRRIPRRSLHPLR